MAKIGACAITDTLNKGIKKGGYLALLLGGVANVCMGDTDKIWGEGQNVKTQPLAPPAVRPKWTHRSGH